MDAAAQNTNNATTRSILLAKKLTGLNFTNWYCNLRIVLRLCYANELDVGLILDSLNKDYDQFVQNCDMHRMGKMIAELHAMMKLHEKGILKKAKTYGRVDPEAKEG
nr:hypothetical protein [Tanacetum cinerariifolium]